MPPLSLKDAAVGIRQAVEQNKAQGLACPFLDMVGAGISYPSVPLASTI